MSNANNQGGFCKTVCWLIGLGAGGYLAYVLVMDFAVDQLQAGVLGIVAVLLVGLLFRRLFCRGQSNRVRNRLKETAQDAGKPAASKGAPAQSKAEASAVMAKAAAAVAVAAEQAEKQQKAEAVFEAPNVEETDARLTDEVNAVADNIAEAEPELATEILDSFEAEDASEVESAGDEATIEEIAEDGPETPVEGSEKPEPLKLSEAIESPIRVMAEVSDAEQVAEAAIEVVADIPEAVESDPLPEKEVLNDEARAAIDAIKQAAAPIAAAPVEPEIELHEVEVPDVAPTPEPEPVVAEAPEPVVAPEPAPEPAPAAGTPPKIKPLEPAGLEGPENDTPDDLTRIDGISEDQENALQGAGIYHYHQFVSMNRRELAWLDENMPSGGGEEVNEGTAGNWRKQAIALSRS